MKTFLSNDPEKAKKAIWLNYLTFFMSILFVVSFFSIQAQTKWYPLEQDHYNRPILDEAYLHKMTVDKSGNAYVAYHNSSSSSQSTLGIVRKFDGQKWDTLGGAFTQSYFSHLAIAVDDVGTCYVGFNDGALGNKLTVKKYDGTNWVTLGTAGFSTGTVYDINLEMDTSDSPVVAYATGWYPYSATTTVQRFNGTSWINIGTGASGGAFLSLAIDSLNVPYVAFSEYNSSSSLTRAAVQKYNGINWVYVGNQSFTHGIAYTSIAIDGSGTPYIAYREGSYTGDDIKVKKFNGSSWVSVGNSTVHYKAVEVNVTIDNSGNPIIIIDDRYYSGRPTVMRYDGSAWVVLEELYPRAYNAELLDIIRNKNGDIYCAFTHGGAVANRSAVVRLDGQGWKYLGDLPIVGDRNSQLVEMHMDNDGYPWVISKYSNEIFLKKFNGTRWQGIDTSGFPKNIYDIYDFAFHPDGSVYVALRDSNYCTVMKHDGFIWSYVGSPRFSDSQANEISIKIDTNGIPYVAYVITKYFTNKSDEYYGYVSKFDGINWVLVGGGQVSSGQVSKMKLALDSNNYPCVAFRDYQNARKATVRQFNGTTWTTIGAAGFTPSGYIIEIDYKIDNYGNHYVLQSNSSNSQFSNLYMFNGNTWDTIGASGIFPRPAHLAIDALGIPYVFFKDISNSFLPTVWKYTGGQWASLGSNGFYPTYSYYQPKGIAFDNQNVPYIAFHELGAWVYKYGSACSATSTMFNQTTCDSLQSPSGKHIWYSNGTYIDTAMSALGCDSIVTINLTITNSNSGSESVTACDSYTWPVNNQTYTSSGNYSDNLSNSLGCDSIVTLNLIVNNSTSESQVVTSCDSYTWPVNNQTYQQSGTYLDTLLNSAACDSIITLNLTLNTSNTTQVNRAACSAYTWPANNQNYLSSGTYQDTLQNVYGCDSIVTLNLTINNPTTGAQTATTCNSYVWPVNNQTYTSTGLYQDTLINSYGCDSIISLSLQINLASTSNFADTACDSYNWPINSKSYTSSGTYTDTLVNANGCDSVISLNLVIINSNSGSVSATACDSYFWALNNQTYTSTGSYSEILTNSQGCDSVVNLSLIINSINNSVTQNSITLSAIENGAVYQWLDCNNGFSKLQGESGRSFTAKANGNYAVQISKNNCVDTSSCFLINTIGVKGFSKPEINIYPNPTEDQLHVEFVYVAGKSQINLYDAAGKSVFRFDDFDGQKLTIDLSNFAKGIYFLKISGDSFIEVEQVVKQ